MSAERIRLRYDGPALAGHQMDVAHLAPALLAVGDICKIANRKFNADKASVQVLVSVDLDHKCFEISFDLVQTLWSHALSSRRRQDK